MDVRFKSEQFEFRVHAITPLSNLLGKQRNPTGIDTTTWQENSRQ